MLQYFKIALWGTVFLIASVMGQMAAAEPQGCVMDSWGAYLNAGPQEYETVELINTENGDILALKFGDITGDYGKVFLFLLDNGDCFTRAVSFGSYEATNAYAVEAGDTGPDGRLYHGDMYAPDSHKTLGFFKTPPTYELAREVAIATLK
jgi:hypothetical protein